MTWEQNKELLPFNTFGLSAKAQTFACVRSVEDVQSVIKGEKRPIRVLGGGSNILFTQNIDGVLIKNEIKGIKVVEQGEGYVHVRVGGGENWHEFVQYAVSQNWGGIENLSLIPGTVGASPIQNIGAYGVEIKDVFVRLRAVDLDTGEETVFFHENCAFGYRDSVFKRTAKDSYLITSVVFELTTRNHKINTSYGDISKTLNEMGVSGTPTIAEVSQAVINIRSSKLPDPAQIGNCGSFFKNPELPAAALTRIRETHPQAPGYELPGGMVKIPAGWLIEQCGWKGKRVGNTGCYEKQALVLVNHGGATGAEVKQLAQNIIASVKAQFGVDIEPEVNIW